MFNQKRIINNKRKVIKAIYNYKTEKTKKY